MSNLIDTSYFIGEVNIPVSSTAALNGNLNDSINLYEDECLKLLLGYKLWKEMKDAYNASVLEVNPIPLTESFNRFINGCEFSFELQGQTIEEKWIGLKNTAKLSLIAYYVYYKHRVNNVSQYSAIGQTKAKAENALIVNPRYQIKGVWNRFIEMMGEGLMYNIHDNSTYRHYNSQPSAYNFLLANRLDYPNWRFTPQEKIYSL